MTANGERYDAKRIGAAHKTLPLPSYVEVTAVDSGRRIVVRVNDRGPFVAGRIIDLSRRAAEMLGTARAGVAPVRVRRVFPDERTRLALRAGKPAVDLPYVPVRGLIAIRARLGNDMLARGGGGGYQAAREPIAPPDQANEGATPR